jgi:FixJ family two-component response regulator
MVDLEQVKVTPRDRQVFSLLVEGCSNKEIAGPLNISLRTRPTAPAQAVFARRNPGWPQAGETGYGHP